MDEPLPLSVCGLEDNYKTVVNDDSLPARRIIGLRQGAPVDAELFHHPNPIKRWLRSKEANRLGNMIGVVEASPSQIEPKQQLSDEHRCIQTVALKKGDYSLSLYVAIENKESDKTLCLRKQQP